jgi:hypothetical protein
MSGYFSIKRKLLNSSLWLERPFSRGQAWVDLIGLANYKDGAIRVAGVRIDVLRGQCGWSELKLAERWGWSRGKIKRFISELETDSRVIVKQDNRTTILTICNYNEYQNQEEEDGTPDRTADSTTDDTPDGHQTDTIKKDNKDNKDKSKRGTRCTVASLPPEWEEYCKQERPDLNPQKVFQNFRDHWLAQPGQKGIKLDWVATWRTWVRKERGSSPAGQPSLFTQPHGTPARPRRAGAVTIFPEGFKKS